MAIELSNIHFYYPDRPDHLILDIPSWSLSEGEQTFIHGPSGSGKSTLLNLLGGLLVPSQGKINILGQQLDEMTGRQRDKFRADHIGYVFQQFNLMPYLNAFDNILLASQFSQKQKSSALESEIKELLTVLNIPQNDWYRSITTLSNGQQQRVAIARALINKPQLLIADEPTSSLDAANRDAFMTLLKSIVKEHGMSLLFVSHDLSLSSHFKRIEPLSEINHIEDAA